jgi:acetyl-CoA C-acetyltransferase
LGSALSHSTPAYDVQQACGTGLETTILVANKIRLGQIEAAVAGGVDSASDAPLAVHDDLRRRLLAAARGKTAAERVKALTGVRPRHLKPQAPENREPRTGLSMGEHQALTTAAWAISRDRQDELALASHRNLASAYERGFFDDLITTHRGLARDQNLRPDTSIEKLAALRPVFGGPAGTMTAGNSTALTDGAATVLLATDEWAGARNLPVLAHVVDAEAAAVDYVGGNPHDDGLLMAGVYAVPRLLDRLGLSLQDFDFYEIHEAFASTVLVQLDAWEDDDFGRRCLRRERGLGPIDRTRLNVVGSSLATGHPFAATGARIVATLAKLLAERGSGRGLISICAAGGQGVAAVLEAA